MPALLPEGIERGPVLIHGAENGIPADERVGIGVFAAALGDVLYLRSHRVRSGRQTNTHLQMRRQPNLSHSLAGTT